MGHKLKLQELQEQPRPFIFSLSICCAEYDRKIAFYQKIRLHLFLICTFYTYLRF